MKVRIPPRPAEGHKGTFGRLLIVGGQINEDNVMLGSAAFAAKAALRSGVGLVCFAGKNDVLVELVKMVPQAIGQKLGEDKKYDAVVIGPGLGQSSGSTKILKEVLPFAVPTVIDADGLNILAQKPSLYDMIHGKCLLTPHPGEFERLAAAVKVKTPEQLAKKLGCQVILKGHETKVTDGQKKWSCRSANPALAAGGTGDVLAGLLGGLLAQFAGKQLSLYDCACLGVEVHALAGMEWSKQHGPAGLMIEELIDLIPTTLNKLRV